MNPLDNASAEIIPTSVALSGEGNVEITFLEKRDQTDNIGLMKTIFIDIRGAKLTSKYEELIDVITDIIDLGLLALRNPDPIIDPRKRFRKLAERQAGYDSDDDANEDI